MNGAAAVLNANVYIREYYNGAAIRSKAAGGYGLKAFDLPDFQGTRSNYAPGFYDAEGVGRASRTALENTVLGWADNIGGVTDECHFVYRALGGDAEIIAHADSVEDTGTEAKGGVIVRELLARNATFALTAQRPDTRCR